MSLLVRNAQLRRCPSSHTGEIPEAFHEAREALPLKPARRGDVLFWQSAGRLPIPNICAVGDISMWHIIFKSGLRHSWDMKRETGARPLSDTESALELSRQGADHLKSK